MPFTEEQFFAVFVRYNEAAWPAQVLLALAAAAAAMMVAWRPSRSAAAAWWMLAALWLWAGAIYHLQHFSTINRAAYTFGFVFMAQAFLFARIAFKRTRLEFRLDATGLTGAALIGYALLLYPLIGYLLGHRYPASPTFGAPCPVTIYTLGMLLWVRDRIPLHLLVIPIVWAVIGGTAAVLFGILEDLALPLAGVLALVLALRHNRALQRPPVAASAPPVPPLSRPAV